MFFLFDCVSFTGVHAEGPFINRNKKGAHQEAHIQDNVSLSQLQSCYGTLDNIRIITLAPELPGAIEVIPNLVDRGIVVALGTHTHTCTCTCEDTYCNMCIMHVRFLPTQGI